MCTLLRVDAINVVMLNIWKVGTLSVKTVCDLSEFIAAIGSFP